MVSRLQKLEYILYLQQHISLGLVTFPGLRAALGCRILEDKLRDWLEVGIKGLLLKFSILELQANHKHSAKTNGYTLILP